MGIVCPHCESKDAALPKLYIAASLRHIDGTV